MCQTGCLSAMQAGPHIPSGDHASDAPMALGAPVPGPRSAHAWSRSRSGSRAGGRRPAPARAPPRSRARLMRRRRRPALPRGACCSAPVPGAAMRVLQAVMQGREEHGRCHGSMRTGRWQQGGECEPEALRSAASLSSEPPYRRCWLSEARRSSSSAAAALSAGRHAYSRQYAASSRLQGAIRLTCTHP